MRSNPRTRSTKNNRKVKSARSLRGGMRSRNKSARKISKSARRSRSLRKTRASRRSKKSRKTRRGRKNMKGGFLDYSALPCHADGTTNWESPDQYGKESCVDLGTVGADTKFAEGPRTLTSPVNKYTGGPGTQAALPGNSLTPVQQAAVDTMEAAQQAVTELMSGNQSDPTWQASLDAAEANVLSARTTLMNVMSPNADLAAPGVTPPAPDTPPATA